MNTNEIKKLLYKQKPTATLIKKKGNVWIYAAALKEPRMYIDFEVPESDMGDAKFENNMEAHLLIRWLKLKDADRL